GERSGAGAHVEHSLTGADPERSDEVRALAREVVAGRPVDDVTSQLSGARRAVVRPAEHGEHTVLGAVRIGHPAADATHGAAWRGGLGLRLRGHPREGTVAVDGGDES